MEEKYISIFEIPNTSLWNVKPKNRFVLPHENEFIIQLQIDKKGVIQKNRRVIQMFNDSLVLYDNISSMTFKKVLFFDSIQMQPEFNGKQIQKIIFFKGTQQSEIQLVPSESDKFKDFYELLRFYIIIRNIEKNIQFDKIISENDRFKIQSGFYIKETHKKCIVKTITFKNNKDRQKIIDDAHHEVNILRQIDNEYFLKFQEVYESQKSISMVFDTFENMSLQEFIKKQDIIDSYIIKLIMTNLLMALDYLHHIGIFLRDIKPDIINYDPQTHHCMITDFSYAQFFEHQSVYKKQGTLGFIAPEIMNEKQYNYKADLFSLGVVFNILLCKYNPLVGLDDNETIEITKKCDIDFDGLQYQKINSIAKDLLKNLLEKDPNKRFNVQQAMDHYYFQDQNQQSQNDSASQQFESQIYQSKVQTNKKKIDISSQDDSQNITENFNFQKKNIYQSNKIQLDFNKILSNEDNEDLQNNNQIVNSIFQNKYNPQYISSNNFETLNDPKLQNYFAVKNQDENKIQNNDFQLYKNRKSTLDLTDFKQKLELQKNKKTNNLNSIVQSSINESPNQSDKNQSYQDQMEIKGIISQKDLMKQIPNFSDDNVQMLIEKNKQIFDLVNKQCKTKTINKLKNQISDIKVEQQRNVQQIQKSISQKQTVLNSISSSNNNNSQNYLQITKNLLINKSQPEQQNFQNFESKNKLKDFQQNKSVNILTNSRSTNQLIQNNYAQFQDIMSQQQNIAQKIDQQKRILQRQFKQNPIIKSQSKSPIRRYDNQLAITQNMIQNNDFSNIPKRSNSKKK